MMLFRRDIEPSCAYCQWGDGQTCQKRGTIPAAFSCRAFRYDPWKRIPPRPVPLRTERFRLADFSISFPEEEGRDSGRN